MTMNSRSTVPFLVQDLRCEYQDNPLGIDVVQPRLSWKLASEQRGVAQSAYQIRVTDTSDVLWETGKVLSHQSIHVPYGGPVLRSGQRCTWQVRVWDGNDQPSAWSEPAWWEMGLLHPIDWQAHWIEPGWQEDPKAARPCPYLRTTFSVDGPVSSARAYITSHGLYELFLNGQRVGNAYFTPGYTSYHRRLQYQTYDITALLQEDENAIGVIVGDGWYRGKSGAFSQRNTYGERLALLVQLHIRYADGHEQLVFSDEGWKATTGPILIHQDGRIRPEKQASYVRALAFDLVPPALQRATVDHLVRLIKENDYHLGTGFLSTPFLCHVLSENGQLDVAYALLKQDTIPSWLYEVKKGATTIREDWDGIGENGTTRGSLNHYSKGAVGSWLYQVVAAIEPGAPGYKHIRFRPRPGGGLTAASARYHSLYGEVASSWQIRNGTINLTITDPANTTATFFLPGA